MTTRTDAHLSALLRHLGAAYYQSVHGEATQADVIQALDKVAEHLREQADEAAAGPPKVGRTDEAALAGE